MSCVPTKNVFRGDIRDFFSWGRQVLFGALIVIFNKN